MSPLYFSITSEGWKAAAREAGREAASGELPARPAASAMWLNTLGEEGGDTASRTDVWQNAKELCMTHVDMCGYKL